MDIFENGLTAMRVEELWCSGFINSKDIREYLVGIRYHFSSLEAAWLVNQCERLTLWEKKDAWQHIITWSNGDPLELGSEEAGDEELEDYLIRYMELKTVWLDRFMDTEDAVYTFSLCLTKPDESRMHVSGNGVYSTYEKCLEAAKYFADHYNDNWLKCLTVEIVRKKMDFISGHESDIRVMLNRDFQIKDVYDHGCSREEFETYALFDRMWFDFPTPFKKGDILYDVSSSVDFCGQRPMVLEKTSVEHFLDKGCRGRSTEDMWIAGYYQSPRIGNVHRVQVLNYMNYEYYPQEKLVDEQKALKVISSFMKDEIDLPLMLNAYRKVLEESSAKRLVPEEEWEKITVAEPD